MSGLDLVVPANELNWNDVVETEPRFPAHVAIIVLTALQEAYGEEFSKIYPLKGRTENQWMQDMVLMTRRVLEGLTPNDIKNGLAKFRKEAWVVNLPKFRSLCEQGGSWLTENEAWIQALEFAGDPTSKITVQAKNAFDAVRQVMSQEGQKAAFYAFRDVYARIVAETKEQGLPQQQYVAKTLPAPPKQPELTPEQQEQAKAMRAKYIAQMKAAMGQGA